MKEHILLGDEAVALGALHAGLSAAYGYPGTPSTEIMEYLQTKGNCIAKGNLIAQWCVNEKTALEAALGVSFAGKRAMVTMKHVGLNVAADPLMNGSLLGIKGGLVIAVADDPGMHSSQNEQDSRYYAAFTAPPWGIPCFEPRNQQEAYDMSREAFEISERFGLPVMLRITTRLAHARAAVIPSPGREQNALSKQQDAAAGQGRWLLLPGPARRNYTNLLARQEEIRAWSESHPANRLELSDAPGLAVITSGLGGNYYDENLADVIAAYGKAPARLHIGVYPLPIQAIRRLCEKADTVLVIEEGQPFIEEKLRGILPPGLEIIGRLEKGPVPRTGELDPDSVRAALGLKPRAHISVNISNEGLNLDALPGRPPQLCVGCPHGDSFAAIKAARDAIGAEDLALCGDIGCYALGAAPPVSALETVVCMGASISMARGAAEAGLPYALAIIGDSTFLHSGLTALIDAVATNAPITVVILDNSIVAMTGCQETIIPSSALKPLILGLGLDPAHYLELEAKKTAVEENASLLRAEMEYRGLSVVVFKRECLEAARKRMKKEQA
jgi:indolepyruvate ferredoxin oxidoreductase alpha subunit